jgi:hypothetical protein
LVTFDAAEHALANQAGPEALKSLKESPSARAKVRTLNSQIASFHLFHARINEVPPTQSLAIPQIVNEDNDQYRIGYQVVQRQGRDGSLLEESLVTIRPNIKYNMTQLVTNLSAAMNRQDVTSLGELMAHPEVATDDIGGTNAKRRALHRSLFTRLSSPPRYSLDNGLYRYRDTLCRRIKTINPTPQADFSEATTGLQPIWASPTTAICRIPALRVCPACESTYKVRTEDS